MFRPSKRVLTVTVLYWILSSYLVKIVNCTGLKHEWGKRDRECMLFFVWNFWDFSWNN